MKFTTPLRLKREHAELGAKLAAMANLPGLVGSVARSVAAVVNSHLEKEEVSASRSFGGDGHHRRRPYRRPSLESGSAAVDLSAGRRCEDE